MQTLRPPQTLRERPQRLSCSSTLRTIRPSPGEAGPGDSAPSTFRVSHGELVRLSWGGGETCLCSGGDRLLGRWLQQS